MGAKSGSLAFTLLLAWDLSCALTYRHHEGLQVGDSWLGALAKRTQGSVLSTLNTPHMHTPVQYSMTKTLGTSLRPETGNAASWVHVTHWLHQALGITAGSQTDWSCHHGNPGCHTWRCWSWFHCSSVWMPGAIPWPGQPMPFTSTWGLNLDYWAQPEGATGWEASLIYWSP